MRPVVVSLCVGLLLLMKASPNSHAHAHSREPAGHTAGQTDRQAGSQASMGEARYHFSGRDWCRKAAGSLSEGDRGEGGKEGRA